MYMLSKMSQLDFHPVASCRSSVLVTFVSMFVTLDSLKDALSPFLCFLQLIMQKVPPSFRTLFFIWVCLCATCATCTTGYIVVSAMFVFRVFSGLISRRVFQTC